VSCRRAFEIDLAAFLAEPARPEHADFRAHYPGCAECAEELHAWTELEASLHTFGAAHPEPAALLRFEERAADLAPPERARIEAHLARCASCRDELRSLRAFPFEDTAATSGGARRSRPPARRSRIGRVRSVVLHPAFAYAVVALLAWPAAQSLLAPAARDAVVGELAKPAASSADVVLLDELATQEKLLAERREQPEAVRSTREVPALATAKATTTAVQPPPAPQATRGAPARPEAKSDAAPATPSPTPAEGAVVPFQAPPAEVVHSPEVRREPSSGYGLAESSPPVPAPAQRASRTLAELRARASRVTALGEAGAESAPPRLRIDLPGELRGEREVLVRVRDSSRLRELRERVQPARGAESIEIALPDDWPAQTSFEVELRGVSSPGDPERVFRQTLTR
jgi:hypothetical protein